MAALPGKMMAHLGTGIHGVSNTDSSANSLRFCRHQCANRKGIDMTDESSGEAAAE
jgi:hypothetical protein